MMTVDWDLLKDDGDDYVFLNVPSPTNHMQGFEYCAISHLSPEDEKYIEVEKLFEKGWKHPEKRLPYIHHIYETTPPESSMSSYIQYRDSVQFQRFKSNKPLEQLLFHGTRRECSYTRDLNSQNLGACFMPTCSLCCILRSSFQISLVGSRHNFRRFGDGIYTTSCSSKADDYVSSPKDSKLRSLLVSRVVVGKSLKIRETTTDILEPPCGYHSILGVPGVDLNYEETVVYHDEAIRPAYLIIYSDLRPLPRTVAQAEPHSNPNEKKGNLLTEGMRFLSKMDKGYF